jgi:hypothetical protein
MYDAIRQAGKWRWEITSAATAAGGKQAHIFGDTHVLAGEGYDATLDHVLALSYGCERWNFDPIWRTRISLCEMVTM